jgi:hypothetical protein
VDELEIFDVFRDNESTEKEQAVEDEALVARGVRFPSGRLVVEWNREAFAEDEQSEGAIQTHYEKIEDVEQASSGVVAFRDFTN